MKSKAVIWPVIVFIISMGITGFTLFTVSYTERQKALNSSKVESHRLVQLLQTMIDRDIELTGSAANFFYSVEETEWGAFPRFAKGVIEHNPHIIGLAWMQKVAPISLTAHMEQVQKSYPEAMAYTATENDDLVYKKRYRSGDFVYIASDIYPPTAENREVIGFYPTDIYFKQVLESLKINRMPYLSDKLVLLQTNLYSRGAADGFLIYYPVFDRTDQELKGVVISAIRSQPYLQDAIALNFDLDRAAIKIMDGKMQANGEQVFYQSNNWEAPAELELTQHLYFTNRNWQVRFRYQQLLPGDAYRQLLMIGAAGIAGSLLITFISFVITASRQRLEQDLTKRTYELEYQLTHDNQTQALSRKAFYYQCDERIAGTDIFSLIIFDVDRFQEVNDRFGRHAGDNALMHIVDIVVDILDKDDRVFRLGGDEFGILCDKRHPVELQQYMEKIRSEVELSPWGKNPPIYLTISLGGAIWKRGDIEALEHRADRAVYKAKASGGNKSGVCAG